MNPPYYIYPDIERLAVATGEERRRLCRRIAAHVDDRGALRTLFGIDPEEFGNFYPDMNPPRLTTEDTIDSFLDRFGKDSGRNVKDEESASEGVVPVEAPAVDYTTMMLETGTPEETDEGASDDTSSAIDAFLKAVPPAVPRRRKEPRQTLSQSEKTPEDDGSDSMSLSESLARIMIKKRNYAKALEIITELSLKNPKKSIYFADQIRFLKKLIINESKS